MKNHTENESQPNFKKQQVKESNQKTTYNYIKTITIHKEEEREEKIKNNLETICN